MILLIDNYDSFVHNLARYLRKQGAQTRIIRNDQYSVAECLSWGVDGVVLSPGPGRPESAGICCALLTAAEATPVLGVCLGHQCMAHVWGGQVVSAKEPMHGRASEIFHDGTGVLHAVPSPFMAGRYHSLGVQIESSDFLIKQAQCMDGEVMAMRHCEKPQHGVQFHPESLLTSQGEKIMENFLKLTIRG